MSATRRRPAGRPDEVRYGALPTEAAHPAARELHRMPTDRVVALLLEEEVRAARTAAAQARPIAVAAERVAATLERGGRVVYVGAGTSGRLGTLDAAELPPTFGLAPDRVVAIMAGGDAAAVRAVEGAEDRRREAAAALARLDVGASDLVCAIAASGVTPFTRAALAAARRRGAATLFVTCAPTGADVDADHTVVLDVGPEVVAGSTRLKAATATRIALNAISTAAMVRLGRVWRGRMVDLVATNAKLRDRARRLLVELGGVDERRARSLLVAARGEVRPALVAALLGVDVREARRRLAAVDGDLDAAVATAAATDGRISRRRRR